MPTFQCRRLIYTDSSTLTSEMSDVRQNTLPAITPKTVKTCVALVPSLTILWAPIVRCEAVVMICLVQSTCDKLDSSLCDTTLFADSTNRQQRRSPRQGRQDSRDQFWHNGQQQHLMNMQLPRLTHRWLVTCCYRIAVPRSSLQGNFQGAKGFSLFDVQFAIVA